MKFEKLSEKRIKITVSMEDLDLWGITATGLIKNTPEAQEVFWYIIRKAETETGFSPGEAKLLVEAIPGKGEGIVLFMTALSEEREHKRLRVKLPREEKTEIYEFESFDHLCASLPHLNNNPPGSLYEMSRKYYLSLDTGEGTYSLSEYGRKLHDGHRYLPYLKEHGNLILNEDAVSRLKEYF